MLQKILIILTALAAFAANMAQAQLSTNPWAEANDEEAVAAVYQKEQRRQQLRALNYTGDDTTTVDRTHAYIQPDEMPKADEDEGIFAKMKNLVSSKGEEPELIPATRANRRSLAESQAPRQEQESADNYIPSMDLGRKINTLQKSLRLPNMPNISVNGMIQKFERASGVNFKKIGKSLK